jgi:hypothetical protein
MVRRERSPVSPQCQTPVPAGASLPRLHSVVVVFTDRRDDESIHTTRCFAHVDRVVFAEERVQLIRTDAGLVFDLPSEAVAQIAVDDQPHVAASMTHAAAGRCSTHRLVVISGKKGMAMALFEDLSLGSATSSTLLGLGLLVAAPLLLPVVGAVVRPLVRLTVQGGGAAYDAAAALVTTAGEELHQLVADARATATSTPAPGAEVAPHIIRPEGASV